MERGTDPIVAAKIAPLSGKSVFFSNVASFPSLSPCTRGESGNKALRMHIRVYYRPESACTYPDITHVCLAHWERFRQLKAPFHIVACLARTCMAESLVVP